MRAGEYEILDDVETLHEAIFVAIGAASVSWEPRPSGEFNSTRAVVIGEELERRISESLAGTLPPKAPVRLSVPREVLTAYEDMKAAVMFGVMGPAHEPSGVTQQDVLDFTSDFITTFGQWLESLRDEV